MSKPPANIAIGVDESPPPIQLILLAIQYACSGFLAPPVFSAIYLGPSILATKAGWKAI